MYISIVNLRNILQSNKNALEYVKVNFPGVLEDLSTYNANDNVAGEICHMVIYDLADNNII